jgi:membrane protein
MTRRRAARHAEPDQAAPPEQTVQPDQNVQNAPPDQNVQNAPPDQNAQQERATEPEPANADPAPTVVPLNKDAPDRPSQLSRGSWWAVLKGTVKEFNNDNLTDWAAALTYYSILSIFPGLLVLFSAFNLLKPKTRQAVIDNLTAIAPKEITQPLDGFIKNLSNAEQAAGILAFVGIATALWAASGYVSAFMRASNAIYDVPEGRPIWKTLPIRLGITIVVGTLVGLAAVSVVFTGKFAEQIGKAIGLGETAVRVWGYAKWPALLVVLMLVLAILYWASPNARHGGFRWITPGGMLAVLVWLLASGGFALYVTNFDSYNKTYGTLGGIIAFLVWLWISNIAILLGAEFDAELERRRAIEGGHPEDEEPFIAMRDDRKVKGDPDLA